MCVFCIHFSLCHHYFRINNEWSADSKYKKHPRWWWIIWGWELVGWSEWMSEQCKHTVQFRIKNWIYHISSHTQRDIITFARLFNAHDTIILICLWAENIIYKSNGKYRKNAKDCCCCVLSNYGEYFHFFKRVQTANENKNGEKRRETLCGDIETVCICQTSKPMKERTYQMNQPGVSIDVRFTCCGVVSPA